MPDSRATSEDVARLAGVSQSTVSRVFSNSTRISAATRERVLQAALQLEYRPNNLARGLITKQSLLIGIVMAGIDTAFAPYVLEKLTIRVRPGRFCYRCRQEGPGFDRNIYSSEALEAAIDYLHNNPVKRGLCRKAEDWQWSSAGYYLLAPLKQQFPELPHIHGLPPGAFDKGQPR